MAAIKTLQEKALLIDAMLLDIESGLSVFKAAKKNNTSAVSFYQWIESDKDLINRYTRAREKRADAMFEEIQEIADDPRQDAIVTDKGIVMNTEFVQRSKLRIDARKWMLAKMQPTKYGDKIDVTSGGNELKPIVINLGSGIEPKNEDEN